MNFCKHVLAQRDELHRISRTVFALNELRWQLYIFQEIIKQFCSYIPQILHLQYIHLVLFKKESYFNHKFQSICEQKPHKHPLPNGFFAEESEEFSDPSKFIRDEATLVELHPVSCFLGNDVLLFCRYIHDVYLSLVVNIRIIVFKECML